MDNLVEIFIGEVPVIGVITHRTNRDVAVEIIEPYLGISNCMHTPCFTTPVKDYTCVDGIETAKYLLNQIYTIQRESEKQSPQLTSIIKKWEEFNSEIHRITQEKKEQKRTLRRKFKLGEINQTHYQNTLNDMNKILVDCNVKLTVFFDDNIQPYFSSTIPFSLRDEVINFIKHLPMSK